MWLSTKETEIENAVQIGYDAPDIKIEDVERNEMVADIMQKIPKGDALLLTLYYMEDNPVKEIAGITGLNESNVKVKLFRARKLFKELLLKHYRDETENVIVN